jgi:hypothetical protein
MRQIGKARFEAALKSALNTPPKPLKEKPKVGKTAKFKSIRIPGALPGPKRGPKRKRALTDAERWAERRAELRSAGVSSEMERIREAKLAPTTMDAKKQKKVKKKPSK